MRWNDLFADLEGRARAFADEDLRAEVVDRTRGETAQIALVNRLRAAVTAKVELALTGGTTITGTLRRVGPDFVLVESTDHVGGQAREHLVVTAAVLACSGLTADAVSPEVVGPVGSRLGLSAMLRRVAADRVSVATVLRDGSARHGTVSRVGLDWLDLSTHRPGDVPRATQVTGRLTVPFGALAVVSRGPGW